MHAAQVLAFGETPQWVEVADIPPPEPGFIQIKVLAVGLSNLTRSRALGNHYSAKKLPHTLGVDGVGEYLTGPHIGKKCFFLGLHINGTYQSIVNVPEADVVLLPESLNAYETAGWYNPAVSSWLAVRKRTTNLPKDFTVVVLGATSASGSIATELMREFGAKKIIGVARNEQRLKEMKLDQYAVLQENPADTKWGDLSGVDLVLDYIFGPPALELMKALPSGTSQRTQYVSIGALAGPDIALPSLVLRSKDIVITGSGIGGWSLGDMAAETGPMLEAMARLPHHEVKIERIQDISKVWDQKDSRRLVFRFDE